MPDQRKYPRYSCSIKTKFEYFTGNPDEVNIDTSVADKGKGVIIDISRGGVFIASNTRVAAGMPVILNFNLLKQKIRIAGHIVRTGLLTNNPSEVARKFSMFSSKGDSYIAVEFSEPVEEFNPEKL
ncbi:MAG TPA: PilZ domain-containing protein [Spirochaetota bacterium]|nr:PilZ domain-containing protein [Spirochaetota bacterium]